MVGSAMMASTTPPSSIMPNNTCNCAIGSTASAALSNNANNNQPESKRLPMAL